jgi:multiple RNA-binding domain-containing protein 1
MLDKHKLQLQLSKGRPGGAAGVGAKKKAGKRKEDEGGTKLLVRNLAFEATRGDIVGLFGPFGHIKSARLPKKFDGNHRGFAFVEFVTKQEAANALEGVGGTHLYGRRLVVEYAQQGEEGLDELRAKAGAKFAAGGDDEPAAAPAKRLKRTL